MNTREELVRDVLTEQANRAHDEHRVLNRLAVAGARNRPKWMVPVLAATATAAVAAAVVPITAGLSGHHGVHRETGAAGLPSWRTGPAQCAYSNYLRVGQRPRWLPGGLVEKGRTAGIDYSERYFTDGPVPDADQPLGTVRAHRTVLVAAGEPDAAGTAAITANLRAHLGAPVRVHGVPGIRYLNQQTGATELAWQPNGFTVRLVSITGIADPDTVVQRIADSIPEHVRGSAELRSPLLPENYPPGTRLSRVTVTGSDPAHWSVHTGVTRRLNGRDPAEQTTLRLLTTDPSLPGSGQTVRVRSFDGAYQAPTRPGEPSRLTLQLGESLWLVAEGVRPGTSSPQDELARLMSNTLLRCHSDTTWLGH